MHYKHTPDMTAYSAVIETCVHELRTGKYIAFIRLKVREPGYNIDQYEDLHRRFSTEREAKLWLVRKMVAVTPER